MPSKALLGGCPTLHPYLRPKNIEYLNQLSACINVQDVFRYIAYQKSKMQALAVHDSRLQFELATAMGQEDNSLHMLVRERDASLTEVRVRCHSRFRS